MTHQYNCRTEGQNYRIGKFDEDFNLITSYTLTLGASGKYYCNCPGGGRESCRHREMLKEFIATGRVDTAWYMDWDDQWWTELKGAQP